MTAQFVESSIKLEADASENVTEIQSYLAGFQKEIGGDSTIQQVSGEDNDGEGEEGTYFVDQAGHYYFQAKGDTQPVMTVMSGLGDSSGGDGEEFIINHENEGEDGEDGDEPLQVRGGENNQILINSGNAYQRVTVVPADTNSGELSYVLIVQDPDLKDGEQTDGDQDLAVYDFDEAEEGVLKRYLLSRHMKSHSEERPHKCSVCERGFKTLASLQNHVNTHTGTKPHACKYCDAAFTTSVGDKPIFQCELCPTTCGRKTDLRIHVQKLHTSDKPLKCKRCGKSFPDRYSYKNLYHNPEYIPPTPREKTHECPECARAFRHKGNLIRHMAAHDPDPTIQRKQLELKLGRQKKIQMIDGQQVEVMPGIGSDEEEEIDMMAVEGSDGQQYVVLEVIQLADGEEQAMVVGDGTGELLGENILPDNDLNDEEVIKALQSARRVTKEELPDEDDDEPEEKKVLSTATDMQNCFGFDEDEDDDEDGIRAGKETITLLGNID
ncbi:hypothetical protein NQ318_003123 [Aromia moschata]|uniref:C2H2-type domain-containing protein n=1 Tax=Aromia moschata TaxID=1265417 RepID=A0AAV8YS67_9CUCU|nr:hypothetical protein NQ318_003123 [Aromia moschata]